MTDPIATLCDYLHSPLSKPPPHVVTEALAALEAELTALRTPTSAITTRAAEVLEPLCVAEEQKRALFVLIASATQLRTSAETMSHELAALRESALDLSRVPDDWSVEIWCVAVTQSIDGRKRFVDGEGSTPAAALSAAIERAKELK